MFILLINHSFGGLKILKTHQTRNICFIWRNCHWVWPRDSTAPPAGISDSYMHIYLCNSLCIYMTRCTQKVHEPKPSFQQEVRHFQNSLAIVWQQLVSDGRDRHVFRAASVASGYLGQDFLFCALIIVSTPISNFRGENGVKSSANWFWDYMSVNAFCLVSPTPARRWLVRITPTETKMRISTYSHQLHPNIHPFTHRESHNPDLHIVFKPPKGRGNFRRTDCPTSRGSHRASGLCQPADTQRSGLIRRPRPQAERQSVAAALEDQRELFPLTAT